MDANIKYQHSINDQANELLRIIDKIKQKSIKKKSDCS